MEKNRLWVIGAALVIAGVVVIGWFLGISPKLDEASASAATRAEVEAQNAAHELELVNLKEQFENIDLFRGELAELRDAIPAGAELPDLVRELDSIATDNQVSLTAISLSDAQPYVAVEGAPSSLTAENFVTIPLSLTVDGDYTSVLNFVAGLQSSERLMLVTAFSTSTGDTGGVTGSISAYAYVLLSGNSAAATATPEPAPAPAPAP
ncbi:MAG TPA: type 4a pilus biogenesis protein PilO [Glaciihabitans sp.]|jgi:Tfp pilus assembly protein PilO|nr:type 4a pilus biogenesis protein PilO [Glaciihabitans sp.]